MTVSKTALGVQVMKDRSVALTAQQRSTLILCDGKRSADEVIQMMAAVGVTRLDLETLVQLGLIEIGVSAPRAGAASSASAEPPSAASAPFSPSAAPDVDFSKALNAAITFCSGLGFKGFSLNMALTGVDSLEKLQKLAPEIRRAAGDSKYKVLHEQIFGKPL